MAVATDIFRFINRPVWIVTAASNGRRGGLLATFVMQASIDESRPVVLAGIGRNHFTAELIDAGGGFGLHLLRSNQLAVAWQFGLGSGRDRDKLAALPHRSELGGSPILQECLAWMDCRVVGTFDTGDRVYYWADVLAAAAEASDEAPLSEQELLAAATPEQLEMLKAHRQTDVAIQRHAAAAWRKKISSVSEIPDPNSL